MGPDGHGALRSTGRRPEPDLEERAGLQTCDPTTGPPAWELYTSKLNGAVQKGDGDQPRLDHLHPGGPSAPRHTDIRFPRDPGGFLGTSWHQSMSVMRSGTSPARSSWNSAWHEQSLLTAALDDCNLICHHVKQKNRLAESSQLTSTYVAGGSLGNQGTRPGSPTVFPEPGLPQTGGQVEALAPYRQDCTWRSEALAWRGRYTIQSALQSLHVDPVAMEPE
ncbi:uncharacterized protein [Globicephala melas]|uniref:uncharacterized protein n=1 Tax=Globicephala melas TaxID=9731 RepID=UPI00387354ED